jgi:hypothetical protein
LNGKIGQTKERANLTRWKKTNNIIFHLEDGEELVIERFDKKGNRMMFRDIFDDYEIRITTRSKSK